MEKENKKTLEEADKEARREASEKLADMLKCLFFGHEDDEDEED